MHGGWWLENPALSISLFCIAFYLLYRALRTKKQHSLGSTICRIDLRNKVFPLARGPVGKITGREMFGMNRAMM